LIPPELPAYLATAYLAGEAEALRRAAEGWGEERWSCPRISIIVPTHNEERYLPRLLRSLERQGCSNIEVIIVDWSSTDRTIETAQRWGDETGIDVIVMSATARGVGYASWLGETATNGDIIVRTDADTEWPPGLLRRAVEAVQRGAKLYWAAFTWYDADPVTTLFTWVARHFRDPCRPHGRFMAVDRSVEGKRSIFNPELDVGEDVEVGEWICREFGRDAVVYDRDAVVLTSARRLYAAGVIPYLTGEEFKIGFPPRR